MDMKFKIIMLGDFAVGKTSLVRRYVHDEFSDQYLTTIGVKVSKKEIIAGEGKDAGNVTMLLWDIAGNDKFHYITPEYVRGSAGGIIVCDSTRRSTILSVQDHVALLHSVNPEAAYVIAMNKSDLVSGDSATAAANMKLLEGAGVTDAARLFITSAREGSGVKEMFGVLASSILSKSR